ncbi:pyrroline-5-carboxylate reductase [Mycoavidus sp. B2-EB]|uniref:pyrroline-5-carboxylate reductase n=1 Tax=Mycoavidus sp. B2-EB TaxID=2651972 RepID=UPI001623193A|nr:pyrroline-5-carboxylate reductase [Mycoavidus sp. B2-EB]
MKIAFIGGGNMANALIGGLIKGGLSSSNLYAIDVNSDVCARLKAQWQIRTSTMLSSALQHYDALVLAVKPQQLKDLAHALAPHLNQQVVISIAAGIRTTTIQDWLGGYTRIVRAMPNTPALIGQGVTGVTALPEVNAAGRKLAETVLAAAGQVIWCEAETQIDAITAISGSGPAYVFYFIEALEAAAQQLGFDDVQSRSLALATMSGATQLATQSNEPASVLRERVTSKGGTTAAALASFTADGVKEAIMRGTFAARARAEQMADEFGQT